MNKSTERSKENPTNLQKRVDKSHPPNPKRAERNDMLHSSKTS